MVTSTVPAAINTLYGYLQTVANNAQLTNNDGPIGVSLGWPLGGNLPNNWAMVGDFSQQGDGAISEYVSDFTSKMPMGYYIQESYQVNLAIVVWSGASDSSAQTDRISDAFTLYNGLCQQIADDPTGSGNLSGSGSWAKVFCSTKSFGPFADAEGVASGWGVILEVAVQPKNIQIATGN